MIKILTTRYSSPALPQFLELHISYAAGEHSFSKPGMVLDYEKDHQLLTFAVFHVGPEELPVLQQQADLEISHCENYMLWGWTAIADLCHASVAVVDCLGCPAILQTIIKTLRNNNNRLFVNVPHTSTQYTYELSAECSKLISFVPNFSDLAREHTFTGVVALGTITSLQDWFKYNFLRCRHFAALIV